MVILYSKEGRLANRLLQAAFFISSALENNYTLIHLGFAEYIIYFDENCCSELKKLGNCRIIDFETTSISNRIIIKYASLSRTIFSKVKFQLPLTKEVKIWNSIGSFDISQESFIADARRKMILADGWLFKDRASFIKRADDIRRIFTPNKIYLENVEKLVYNYFSRYAFVIGVHIRKGDYSAFKEGKYFFSDEDYISFIKQISLLPSLKNLNIAFFLCSDENITIKSVDGVNLIFPTKHLVEDLYALSKCNYIIGPPSTYSAWASFYGKVPLLHLENNETIIKEENFKITWV